MSNEPDKVNSGALATMIVLVALTTLAVALVVTALVRQETTRLQAVGDQNQERPFRQLRSNQETKLNDAPAWVEREAGLASISIDSAMQIVLEDIRENPLALSPGNKPTEDDEALKSETPEPEPADAEGVTEGTPQSEEAGAEKAPTAKPPAPTPVPKTAPKAPAPTTNPAPQTPAPQAPAPKTPAPAAPKAPAPSPAPIPSPAPKVPAQ